MGGRLLRQLNSGLCGLRLGRLAQMEGQNCTSHRSHCPGRYQASCVVTRAEMLRSVQIQFMPSRRGATQPVASTPVAPLAYIPTYKL